MADINAGEVLRFENGGRITITPEGGSASVIKNILAGTVTITPTMYGTLPPDVDRGELLTHIRKSDMQPGSLGFDVRYTHGVGPAEMYETLTADSGNQNKIKHDILVEHFTDNAKTVGRSFTLSNAVVAGQPNFSTGTETDQIGAAFITPSAIAVAAIGP